MRIILAEDHCGDRLVAPYRNASASDAHALRQTGIFPAWRRDAIIHAMRKGRPIVLRKALVISSTALALSALTGVAFAMWMDNGARIFMTMIESGLAWCF